MAAVDQAWTMMSAPHLAAVALPVMAMLARRTSFVPASGIMTQPSPTPQDSFVVGREPATAHRALGGVLALGTAATAAYHACASVFELKGRLTAHASMLSDVQDEMAEDEGDEDDWYAEERAARTKAALAKQLNEKLMDLEPIHVI